jgi:hypothetical protein
MDTAPAKLAADAAQIARFVYALFRYADPDSVVALRSFFDDASSVHQTGVCRIGDGLEGLVAAATAQATGCAQHPRPVVFCPPVATFAEGPQAREQDLLNGLALSVECDTAPNEARLRLEGLLGPATLVVRSGGCWIDDQTGAVQDKLHLHWRLTEPTRDAATHAALKQARTLAAALVGGDRSNAPPVHPIRWPGSWHRKGSPRLAVIIAESDAELELGDALEVLADALPAAEPTRTAIHAAGVPVQSEIGEARDTSVLIQQILTAADYHAPLVALAMRYLKGGMAPAQVVLTLRGLLLAVPEAQRDIKDGHAVPGRWQARYDDAPRAVTTARRKLGEGGTTPDGSDAPEGAPDAAWPEPIDFLADAEMTGAPELRPEHLPPAIAPFVADTAARMGVDPATVALAALVTLSSVAHETWRLQPKQIDDTWREGARIWGAIVGDPSILKTPVIQAATRPIDNIDMLARGRHELAMTEHRAEMAALKADNAPPGSGPPPPRLDRYLVENSTVEALTEVLRDDPEAKQRVPMGKVLIRQDEMSEWLANMDRYRAGGRGGSDRGAYLRLYNGTRFVVDRVGRGTLSISSWSACIIGGIQPEPIQRIAREAADDGLLQRFCYAVPARQDRGIDRKPDHASTERYHGLVKEMAGLLPPAAFPGAEPRVVVLHPDAQAHRAAILDLAEAVAAMPDTSSRLKAALGKWPGLFARMTLLFQLIDHADALHRGVEPPEVMVVPEPVARRSAAYLRDVLLPHLLRAEAVMFSSVQSGHARWIAGFILSREDGRIALRDVVRAYGPLKAPERRHELLSVMQSLETMGWLKAEPQENPARPPTAWEVNPLVRERFARRAAEERTARQQAKARIAATLARVRQVPGGAEGADNDSTAALGVA